jgi:cytochrome o ubiquinol oxidase subunit 3
MTAEVIKSQSYTEPHLDLYEKTLFGFWVYIMTDCVLFATFFATYAVLHNSTFGGPTSQDLFNLPFALTETLILLTSSFTCGLAMLNVYQGRKYAALLLFFITTLLGLSFLGLELYEFKNLIEEGNSWQRSGFLTSYFSLVGCHGLHITCGLIWMFIMMIHILVRGLSTSTIRRLACLSLFWHFLDVIWVLIFTIVYLMGVT